MRKIIIGTRGSELALWQANHVKKEMENLGLEVEIKILKTQGDNIQHLSFDKLEGKGFFTKELEEALLNKTVDLAVHSHKDLPTTNPTGLIIAAVSEREDPCDLLLIRKENVDKTKLFSLKEKAIVGTSSLRRRTQLQGFRIDVEVKELRGNVPTRINKLREGLYDAIIIACAGVERLKLDVSDLHSYKIPAWQMVPAPAQGVLALQIREEDESLKQTVSQLNNSFVKNTIGVERGVLNLFDGGCQLPLGVYCEPENGLFKTSVSKAISADKAPVRLYFETNYTNNLHQEIVSKFNSIKPQKVFISANENDFTFFKKSMIDNDFMVFSKSFIDVESVHFSTFQKTDWIFFNSKNAVKFFFETRPNIGNSKLAAIGEASANLIRNFGYEVSFVGHETSTTKTAQKFAQLAANQTVLFPQSSTSLKTIASFIKSEFCFFLDVYNTTELIENVDIDAELFVFTSPSNANAFFKCNRLDSGKKIVAIGDATAKAITKYNVEGVEVARKPSELCLLEKVYELCIDK